MLFSTPFFLFVFLPIFLILYLVMPFRAVILLLGSLVFYGWSEPQFLWVVLISGCFDWWLGRLIARDGRFKTVWLVLGVVSNLGLLVYAKYAIFGVTNLNSLLSLLGSRTTLAVPDIALPLGVSFIVFEKITYLVDLYRKVAQPARSLLSYLNYVFLFPKLLAGPIIKYHDIAQQLSRPSHCYEDVREGTIRFLVGLGKKVLIADLLSPTADAAFSQPANSQHPSTAWLGLICFTLQIYFDFSGYSDMAIGMGRILGFRLLENFNDPYLATSFTDFWRRWHISLSSWIKEYLYIPLGGSRVSKFRAYLNLCICFLLSGLWHGASWNFVIWGCFHGVCLVADRMFWLEWQKRLPRFINIGITFFLVCITWVFFRCETFTGAMRFLGALAGAGGPGRNDVVLKSDTLTAILAGLACILWPAFASSLLKPRTDPTSTVGGEPPGFVFPRSGALAGALVLLLLSAGRLSISSFHPFLYFRF